MAVASAPAAEEPTMAPASAPVAEEPTMAPASAPVAEPLAPAAAAEAAAAPAEAAAVEASADVTPVATPAKSAAPKEAPQPLSEDEVRAKLRAVFDEFDVDGSGAVGVAEMSKMVAQMSMDISDEQLAEMIKEADADGSGEIEFEEFLLILKKQMESGGEASGPGTGLGSIFSAKTDSMFGKFMDTLTPLKVPPARSLCAPLARTRR